MDKELTFFDFRTNNCKSKSAILDIAPKPTMKPQPQSNQTKTGQFVPLPIQSVFLNSGYHKQQTIQTNRNIGGLNQHTQNQQSKPQPQPVVNSTRPAPQPIVCSTQSVIAPKPTQSFILGKTDRLNEEFAESLNKSKELRQNFVQNGECIDEITQYTQAPKPTQSFSQKF